MPDVRPVLHLPDRPALPEWRCMMGRPATPEIDVARIERALKVMAALVIDDPVYMPIYLRLERELEDARTRQDALARARRLLGKD